MTSVATIRTMNGHMYIDDSRKFKTEMLQMQGRLWFTKSKQIGLHDC
jgi:hypothetical protein